MILIVLCEPVYISYSYMDIPFKIMKVLLFVYVLCENFFRKKFSHRSKAFYCLIVYELILLVSTLINGTSLYHWALYGMTFISAYFFTEKYIRSCNYNAIKSVLNVFLLFLILNILSFLFHIVVQDRGTTFYFLGLRTRVTDSVYVFLLALILYSGKRRFQRYLVAGALSIAATLIFFNVSTLMIGLIAFLGLFLLYRWPSFRNLVANRFFFVIIAMVIIGVVVFRIQQNMDSFFALFGKSADFSYRTYIWDSALSRIKESPLSLILGHGVTELGEWAFFEGRRWQAHNQFLQVALDGGVLALSCFLIMTAASIRRCISKRTDRRMYACFALFVSYIVIMITEIYSYYPQFYVIIAMFANAAYLPNEKRKNTDRGKP